MQLVEPRLIARFGGFAHQAIVRPHPFVMAVKFVGIQQFAISPNFGRKRRPSFFDLARQLLIVAPLVDCQRKEYAEYNQDRLGEHARQP